MKTKTMYHALEHEEIYGFIIKDGFKPEKYEKVIYGQGIYLTENYCWRIDNEKIKKILKVLISYDNNRSLKFQNEEIFENFIINNIITKGFSRSPKLAIDQTNINIKDYFINNNIDIIFFSERGTNVIVVYNLNVFIGKPKLINRRIRYCDDISLMLSNIENI